VDSTSSASARRSAWSSASWASCSVRARRPSSGLVSLASGTRSRASSPVVIRR